MKKLATIARGAGQKCRIWLAVGLLLAAGGCGGGNENAGQGGTSVTPAPANNLPEDSGQLVIKAVPAKDLPQLAGPSPPVDDGRVQFSSPIDWKLMPRNASYLIGFYTLDPNAMPRIMIKVEDVPDSPVQTTTLENLPETVAFVTEHMKGELVAGEELIEPVIGMMLGEVPVARYVRGGRMRNAPVERQFLRTIVNGRMYTVEMQVYAKTLLDDRGTGQSNRDVAYAVAASMKVLEP